jgi:hypothetical protein
MVFLFNVFYQDQHILFPLGKMIKRVEHVMNHFNIIFGHSVVFVFELLFNVIHVNLEIQDAFKPISVDSIIGIG